MAVELSMLDEACSATFWSDKAATLKQISPQLQPLRQKLTDMGLIVNELAAQHGTLSKQKKTIQHRLVDIIT